MFKKLDQLIKEHNQKLADAKKIIPFKPVVFDEGYVVLPKPVVPAEEPKARPFFSIEIKLPGKN